MLVYLEPTQIVQLDRVTNALNMTRGEALEFIIKKYYNEKERDQGQEAQD